MVNLPNFNAIHWTATAFAYASLVSGLLSTFFSFYVQQILSDLHRPEDVREWLTTSPPRFLVSLRRRRRLADHRVPSLTAAAALTAPSRLLIVSIIMLFVALGIFLGSLYTANLGSLKGTNANLAVLLFFIIFAMWALLELLLPLSTKQMEQLEADRQGVELRVLAGGGNQEPEENHGDEDIPVDAENLGVQLPPPIDANDATVRQALEASIRAQEESLQAQRLLLRLLA